MKKVAKLVRVSLITRVIVNEGDGEDTILEAAKSQLVEKVMNDLGENVDSIAIDDECPFDPEHD